MPVVKIDMWEGRDRDTKQKLIKAVSKAVSETLDRPVEHVQVIVNDVPKDNWGLHGEQASRL